MADFHFNPSCSFETNLNAFLQYMKQEDAELGALLADGISQLKGAVNDAQRKTARTSFNTSVKAALDKKIADKETGGGK